VTPPVTEPGPADRFTRVALGDFSGPLDLLLHLVRTGEIDITGLPVVEVVRQCDAYLLTIEALDLETAGEHLVLAATLVHMKSRRLLPPDPREVDAAIEPQALTERAAEAVQELRRAAEQLQEREAAMELVFTRPPGAVAEFAGEQGIEADLYSLVSAFQAILGRLGAEPETLRITREKVSLMDRMTWLIDLLHDRKRVAFRSLFDGLTDRLGFILTFLALLEVLRLRVARAFQSHHQEDILIVLADEEPATERGVADHV